MKIAKLLPLAVVSMALCTGSAYAVTPIGAEVRSDVRVAVYDGENVLLLEQTDSDGSGVVPGAPGSPILTFAQTEVFDDTGFASAFARSNAAWSSASAGWVELEWGWQSSGFGNVELWTKQDIRSGFLPNWSYTFTPSRNSFFTYTVSGASGDSFGLLGAYVSGGTFPNNFFSEFGNFDGPANGSGSSPLLLAGNTYSVYIYQFGNVAGAVDDTARAAARIDWRIAAVPEPGTWLMMIVGFGAIGAALRRRALLPA